MFASCRDQVYTHEILMNRLLGLGVLQQCMVQRRKLRETGVIVRGWVSGWSRMGVPTHDQGLAEPLTYCVALDTGSLSLVLQRGLGLKDS